MSTLLYRTRIQPGETLPQIALRALGSADRWVELVTLNRLQHPYIVADAAAAAEQPGTRYPGQELRLPRPVRVASGVSEDDLYGRDLALQHKRLTITETGDLGIVFGADNLHQALRHRIATDLEELLRHPTYGCRVHVLIGRSNTGTRGLLARALVMRALQDEPRVEQASVPRAESIGDSIEIEARVVAVSQNSETDLNLVLTPQGAL